jgi:protein-arginine kinase activator protein McsA
MIQKDKLGGGVSQENYYETWEIKICPNCKRVYREFYSVKLVGERGKIK